jgi:hypothetical protein
VEVEVVGVGDNEYLRSLQVRHSLADAGGPRGDVGQVFPFDLDLQPGGLLGLAQPVLAVGGLDCGDHLSRRQLYLGDVGLLDEKDHGST